MSHTKEFEHLKVQLEAIISATNNFAAENCIGRGGFGKVYKGEIAHSKGQSMVAFKRLDRAFGQGNPEFWKEIMTLSIYRHENIVSLLGFCDESDEMILVYQYACKGSLDLYLNNGDLTWIQRLKICIGAARGLAYLHNPDGTQLRLLHRDIKSSNILLDENWNAMISDFGLSKFGPANQQFTFLVSHAVGTIGYCDPLYVEMGFLTKESDVYSFGVVLFEVLCGRLCVSNNNDMHQPLTRLVRDCYEHNKINEIVHDNIKDEINPRSLMEFTKIAYQCLKRDREGRPLMTEVVRKLQSALEYQVDTEICKLMDIEQTRGLSDTMAAKKANAESSKAVDNIRTIVDDAYKNKISWELPDIVDSSHLKALRLPNTVAPKKVMHLIYTNSGSALLALVSSAIYKLWKWQRSERNPSGKSTVSIVPQLWQPTNGALMSNYVSESKPAEESAACIALSKNDSYVISASGGKVSLFNMMTYKVLTTFMQPPPAATYLAFHAKDNNIIAIGMEDSTIQIYDVRVDEVKVKLKGHQKQITGLSFSQTLNALVSSGADAQLCIWNINGWEKMKSRSIQSPPGHPTSLVGETKVQFHKDQLLVLVVHESQIAIYDYQLECLRLVNSQISSLLNFRISDSLITHELFRKSLDQHSFFFPLVF